MAKFIDGSFSGDSTLPCIASHCIALHCLASPCIALHFLINAPHWQPYYLPPGLTHLLELKGVALPPRVQNQRKELGHLKAKKAAVVKAKKKKTVMFGVDPSQYSSDGGSESDDGFAYSATTNAAESD